MRGIGAGLGHRGVDGAQPLKDLADQCRADPAAAQRRQEAPEAVDQRRDGFGRGAGRAGHLPVLVFLTCEGKGK